MGPVGKNNNCFRQGCPSENFNELVNAAVDGTTLPNENDDFRCGVARLQKEKPQFVFGGVASKLQEFPFAVLMVRNTHGMRGLPDCELRSHI